MKTAWLALTLSLIVHPASSANAGGGDCDLSSPPARWAARHEPGDARFAVTSQNGEVTLMLTRSSVALQLSDHTFHHVDRKLRQKERERDQDDEENPLADAIRTAVLSSVRALLDHSAECPIRDVKDVDYRGGELIFTLNNGERLFRHVELDDTNVMQNFSASDAHAFVREFRRLTSQIR
jgi:hypothetical protein